MTEDTTKPEEAQDEAQAPVSERRPVKSIRSSQRSFKLMLPCGIVHEDKVLRSVTLQTLTAGDRHVFGDRKLIRNPGQLVSTLIEMKLQAIDGIRTVTQRHIDDMLGFDRDFITFHLRQETTNNRDFASPAKCPSCGSLNEIVATADEVERTLKIMPDEVRLNRKNGRTVYAIELEEYGFTGLFAYPDGHVQRRLGPKLAEQDANPFDVELEALKAVCVDFNGEGPLRSTEDLSIEFVEAVQAEMRKQHYGYNMRVDVACYSCGYKMRPLLDPLDFLFGSLKART